MQFPFVRGRHNNSWYPKHIHLISAVQSAHKKLDCLDHVIPVSCLMGDVVVYDHQTLQFGFTHYTDQRCWLQDREMCSENNAAIWPLWKFYRVQLRAILGQSTGLSISDLQVALSPKPNWPWHPLVLTILCDVRQLLPSWSPEFTKTNSDFKWSSIVHFLLGGQNVFLALSCLELSKNDCSDLELCV